MGLGWDGILTLGLNDYRLVEVEAYKLDMCKVGIIGCNRIY